MLPALGDVVIEAFGCQLPPAIEQALPRQPQTVWLNLEYLSAEEYVPRAHGLPSPVMHGPAKGLTKWFYYPGFGPQTGGLIREPQLDQQQAQFDVSAWRHRHRAQRAVMAQERWISLFCYEPPPLIHLMRQLSQSTTTTYLCVTAGRAQAAVAMACQGLGWSAEGNNRLNICYLDPMPQTAFDQLLWACDLNFVRGEDSLVRAIWSGKPMVWHIYPQDDLAHHAKLQAFYATSDMPRSLRQAHDVWNDVSPALAFEMPAPLPLDWVDWAQQFKQQLHRQSDLSTQLVQWIALKRAHLENR